MPFSQTKSFLTLTSNGELPVENTLNTSVLPQKIACYDENQNKIALL